MSEENKVGERISPSRISIEIGELSSKQRNAVLGLIKDMGFTPEEIREVVVELPSSDDGVAGERLL